MVAHYDNIAPLMSGHRVPAQEIDAEEHLFRQALETWHAVGPRAATAQALFGLGLVYQVLHGDWASAMPYFWQALELADANEGTGLYLRSEVHRHVGFYFLAADEQPAGAVRHLQLSLDLREQLGDPRRIPSGQVALAQAELQPATATGRSNCCGPLSCRPGKPGCWLSGSRTPSAPCGRPKPPRVPAPRTSTPPADPAVTRPADIVTAPPGGT